MSSLGVTTAVRERVEAVRVGPGRAVTAPPPCPPGMRRHLPYTLPGLWFALLFTCLSFTPSLLPRSGLVQGLVCGINAAIGYGLGVFAAAAWRAVADRDARTPRQASWPLLAVAAAVSPARRARPGPLLAGPHPRTHGRRDGPTRVVAAGAAGGRRRAVRGARRRRARPALALPPPRPPAAALDRPPRGGRADRRGDRHRHGAGGQRRARRRRGAGRGPRVLAAEREHRVRA